MCLSLFPRKSRSITFGVGVSGRCTAPSVWREEAWWFPSSPARSVSDRWRGKDRYSSLTLTSKRYTKDRLCIVKSLMHDLITTELFSCVFVCILFRPCPPTHHCQRVVRVYHRLKLARMLSDCPSLYARKFVPVWMPPAHAAVTGECWLAGWTSTGNFACTKIICMCISTRQNKFISFHVSPSGIWITLQPNPAPQVCC